MLHHVIRYMRTNSKTLQWIKIQIEFIFEKLTQLDPNAAAERLKDDYRITCKYLPNKKKYNALKDKLHAQSNPKKMNKKELQEIISLCEKLAELASSETPPPKKHGSITITKKVKTTARKQEEEYIYQLYIEERFFSLEQWRKTLEQSETLSEYTSYFNTARKQPTQKGEKQNFTGSPARRIITSYVAAIRQSFETYLQAKKKKARPLQTKKEIKKALGWHMHPGTLQAGSTLYSSYTLAKNQTCDIACQMLPAASNLGNLQIHGVGKYNTKPTPPARPGILYIINEITGEKPVLERKLATLMLMFSRSGEPVTKALLKKHGFVPPTGKTYRIQAIRRLMKVLHLICIDEIARALSQDAQKKIDKKAPTRVPFAFALARTLKLLEEGWLRMKDVFGPDAEFGPFTAEGATNKAKNATKEKIKKINALYHRCIADFEEVEKRFLAESQGKSYYPSPHWKPLRTELQDTAGDESDAENDDEPAGYELPKVAKTK